MRLRTRQRDSLGTTCSWVVLVVCALAAVVPSGSTRGAVASSAGHSCVCGMGCEGECCCSPRHKGQKRAQKAVSGPSRVGLSRLAKAPRPVGPCLGSLPCDAPDAPMASPGFPGKMLMREAWGSLIPAAPGERVRTIVLAEPPAAPSSALERPPKPEQD